MKAVTLHQPWATLIAIGAKQYETRSWPTKHRGPIAIHASKKWTRQLQRIAASWPFNHALLRLGGLTLDKLPLGKLVAIADLTDCILLEQGFQSDTRFAARLKQSPEDSFGDWAVGRYVWKLENVRPVVPTEVRGYQGIYEIHDSIIAYPSAPTPETVV